MLLLIMTLKIRGVKSCAHNYRPGQYNWAWNTDLSNSKATYHQQILSGLSLTDSPVDTWGNSPHTLRAHGDCLHPAALATLCVVDSS